MRRGRLVVEELGERGAVGKRAPEVRIGGHDPVAVAAEIELANDALVKQADHVGAGADQIAIVAERLLQRAGTAELVAALEDQDLLAGKREVGSRGQPVMAAADDDRVPLPR